MHVGLEYPIGMNLIRISWNQDVEKRYIPTWLKLVIDQDRRNPHLTMKLGIILTGVKVVLFFYSISDAEL